MMPPATSQASGGHRPLWESDSIFPPKLCPCLRRGCNGVGKSRSHHPRPASTQSPRPTAPHSDHADRSQTASFKPQPRRPGVVQPRARYLTFSAPVSSSEKQGNLTAFPKPGRLNELIHLQRSEPSRMRSAQGQPVTTRPVLCTRHVGENRAPETL